MKKIIAAILIIAALVMAFAACSTEDQGSDEFKLTEEMKAMLLEMGLRLTDHPLDYDIIVEGAGFGISQNDKYLVDFMSKKPITVRVSITADGKIIDCLTVSQFETGVGEACGNEEFYSQFVGKTQNDYNDYKDIDGISGATWTNKGYYKAIENAFDAVVFFEGGAQ